METTVSRIGNKKKVATMVDWSNLHQDLISCFARQIVSMKDFYAFRGVGKSWRSEAIKENSNAGLRLQHIVPILILSKEIDAPIRNFYSLTKGQCCQLVDLPETVGKVCYSSLGWFLTETPYLSRFHLLNPLTHARIELPCLRPYNNIQKFVLSSSPSWTSNYGVIVIITNYGLELYKPGYNNDKWTHIPAWAWTPVTGLKPLLTDAIYYKGQFYAVDYLGNVVVCDIENPSNARMRPVAPQFPNELLLGIRFKNLYLVESATGTLLLVLFLFEERYESTIGCRVFEVPFDDGKSWAKSEVKNLGNKTLFVGVSNSSFWIEPLDDSICKANCIYFINRSHISVQDDIDIGIYYMEDGKIEKHPETLPEFHHKGRGLITLHSWLQPSF